jgi:hypothetical protein
MPRLLRSAVISLILPATLAGAQIQPIRPAIPTAPISDKDFRATQDELLKMLRLSPTLTTVVSHDPSLLSDQEYVSRNNPQLAAFLAAHPEVTRNPDFYLFTRVKHDDGSPNEELERAVWPELIRPPQNHNAQEIVEPLAFVLGFGLFLGTIIWLLRQFLENRRWSRIFKLQSEVHGRLIDKFSSTQELAQYMATEAGKRFLEAAPISAGIEPEQPVPNAVARVLTPLQIGIVLVLLGIGLLLLRHVSTDTQIPMLIFGTIALMPGLGFIISAGVTWVLAERLGLMPESPASASNSKSPFGSRENQ